MKVSKFSRTLLEVAARMVFKVCVQKRMLFEIHAGMEYVRFSGGYFRLDFQGNDVVWYDDGDDTKNMVKCSSIGDIKMILYKIPEYRYCILGK